jgi:hypothetical protein
MIMNGNPVQSLNDSRKKSLFPMTKWLSGLLMLLLAIHPAIGLEDPDDQYLKIYGVIEQADSLSKNGQSDAAKSKYQQAQSALAELKRKKPTWNTKVVSYRLNYVSERITALSKSNAAPATAAPPESTGASPATATPGATKAPAGAPAIQIKLLEAGAEPRQALRLQPKQGDKQTETLAMKITMDMGMGAPVTLPKMTLPMEITIKSVDKDGNITYDMTYGQATVEDEPGGTPGLADTFKTALSGISGLTGTGGISARGVFKKMEMKYPADATPQLRQTVDQMKEGMSSASIPFPEEAIGVGAKWEVKQVLKSQGMTINQTATYELVSIEGGQVVIKSAIEQTAANQKIQNPAMGGLKADVVKMTGHYAGSLTWNSTKILPTTGSIDGDNEMALSMTIGNQKQPMNVKTTMKMQLESK